ncbi:glycosyltransferase [Clostridium botulinum]|uniref:glycosyltransferase n=1 Tax=Clostridium botulinum TaxID=1491 RepID=UPI0011301878
MPERGILSNKFFNNIYKLISDYDTTSYPSITCSIIIYNESCCIQRCISSIYNEFDEIILLDSISTDNTLNIV